MTDTLLTQSALGRDRPHDTCRAPFGHNWAEDSSDVDVNSGLCVLRMRCTKCTTTFHQNLSFRGELLGGRKYKYVADYKDPNHWTRSDWRLNFLLKLNARRR